MRLTREDWHDIKSTANDLWADLDARSLYEDGGEAPAETILLSHGYAEVTVWSESTGQVEAYGEAVDFSY
jgi:hypothetical protein